MNTRPITGIVFTASWMVANLFGKSRDDLFSVFELIHKQFALPLCLQCNVVDCG